MKKYLLGLLAVPIMSPLLSIASADTTDLTFTSNGIYPYSPDTFTLSSSSVISVKTAVATTNSYGGFYLCDNTVDSSACGSDCSYNDNYEYVCDSSVKCLRNDDMEINTCNGVSLSAGTYVLGAGGDNTFDTLVLEVSSSPSAGGSESELPLLTVPSSFTSGITDLVNNFGSTVANWLPTVILITLGVTVIFVLFRVVRSYARRSFKG